MNDGPNYTTAEFNKNRIYKQEKKIKRLEKKIAKLAEIEEIKNE